MYECASIYVLQCLSLQFSTFISEIGPLSLIHELAKLTSQYGAVIPLPQSPFGHTYTTYCTLCGCWALPRSACAARTIRMEPYSPSPMTDILTSPQVMSHPSGLRQHCKHQIFLGFPLHSMSSVICSVCASQNLTGTFENLFPFNTDNTVPLLTK